MRIIKLSYRDNEERNVIKLKCMGKALLSIGLILHLTACGTLLYPERKGQTGGRIDPGVAALNGIGLLLFVIPGLVAFAVDFHNGTIYLPGTTANDHPEDEGLYAIQHNGPLTYQQAQKLVSEHFGAAVDLSKAEQKSLRGMNKKALAQRLQQVAY